MEIISLTEISLRLLTAAALGGAIGLERERNEWAAGIRTHTIVAIGAALAMIVSIHGFSDVAHIEGIDLDPSRVAAQVVSGIGFIGAGTILFLKQEIIKGLTTAAAIWSVAAIGLAAGGGMYGTAAVATILILTVLLGIKRLEQRYLNRGVIQSFSFTLKDGAGEAIPNIERIITEHHIKIIKITIKVNHDKSRHLLILFSKFTSKVQVLKAFEKIQALPAISKAEL